MDRKLTITEVLQGAVERSGLSLYAISRATGLNEDSLSRFMRRQQSLRLDKADILAAYFGIRCIMDSARKQ